MNKEEYIEKEIIPTFREVLKKLFEKDPQIKNMFKEELHHIRKDKDDDDDDFFSFLMK
jgi:hypothetical protein